MKHGERQNRAEKEARTKRASPPPGALPPARHEPGEKKKKNTVKIVRRAAHLFVPAFEDDGEGSVSDQVLPAELKLPHRLHGAAGGGTAAGTTSGPGSGAEGCWR